MLWVTGDPTDISTTIEGNQCYYFVVIPELFSQGYVQ
jgi:hypothetical protein